MSKTKKTGIKHALLTLVALVVIIGIYTFITQFSNIAKSITERVATDALKTPVKIAEMKVDLQNLSVEVKGITVKTPAGHGFKKDNVMTLDRILVDGKSFADNVLVFDEINVAGLNVYFEAKPDKTNLGVLKQNLSSDAPKGAKTSSTSNDAAQDPIKVVISKLSITEGKLHPSVALIEKELSPVALPNLKLVGIGEKNNGVLAQDALQQVLTTVINAAAKTGLSSGYFEGVKSIFGNSKTVDDIKSRAKDAGSKLKGLFGN